MKFEDIRQWIHKHSEMADLVGKVSQEEITLAEEELNITFPSSYRLFLETFGCGNVGSIEIFGLGVKPIGVPSLIWITKVLRSESRLLPHLLPIEHLGDGAYACLTTEQSEMSGYQSDIIVEWSSNHSEFRKISGDLNEYLLERFQAGLR